MRLLHGLHAIPLRCRTLFRRRRVEQDLDDELRYHVEQQTSQNLAQGMTPAEARRDALRSIGSITAHKEAARDTWGVTLLDELSRDIRYAFRGLRRTPGFSSAAIVTVALGIASSTAVFSIADATILRTLPYRDPGQLVQIWETNAAGGVNRSLVSPSNFRDWRDRATSFTSWALYWIDEQTLTGDGDAEVVRTAMVTPGIFDVLDVRPVLGSAFPPGSEPFSEAIISYSLWQRRFGGDPGVVGLRMKVNGSGTGPVVAGVMPAGFAFPAGVDVWTPMEVLPDNGNTYRGFRYHEAIARLSHEVSLETAAAELATIQSRLAEEYPVVNAGWGVRVESLGEATVGEYRRSVVTLLASVIFLALVGCTNVSNLMLARVWTERQETVLKIALGASRGRVIRQKLTESLVLGVLGGLTGVLASAWLVRAVIPLLPPAMPRIDEIGIDGRALVFALGASLTSVILVGVLPSIRESRFSVSDWKTHYAIAQNGGARRLLIAGEVALTLILLVGAGLFFQTFRNLRETDSGLRTDGILAFDAEVAVSQFTAQNPRPWFLLGQYFEDRMDSVASLPGITGVAAASRLPFSDDGFRDSIWPLEGASLEFRRPAEASDRMTAVDNRVTPQYFTMLGIPLVRGRLFDDRDRATELALTDPVVGAQSRRVAIVNQTLARRMWPDQDAIGQLFATDNFQDVLEVVGVVADAVDMEVGAVPEPQWYEPLLQNPRPEWSLLVRAEADDDEMLDSVARELRSAEGDLVVRQATTLDSLRNRTVRGPRLMLVLVGAFASLAVLLSAVGIYGVLSYLVTGRTAEIGIRAALGATPGRVLRTVLAEAFLSVVAGLAVGIGGAFALGGLVEGLLYGVEPADPFTVFAVTGLFLIVALLSAVVPARRASHIDPMSALRRE